MKLLQGDFKLCSFKFLKKIDVFITDFFSKVKKDHSISEGGFNDMLLWKKHKIFSICIKSMQNVNFLNKIGILFFLISKSYWLKDSLWRSKLKEIFYD